MQDAMDCNYTMIIGAMFRMNFLALIVFFFIYPTVALGPRNLLRMCELEIMVMPGVLKFREVLVLAHRREMRQISAHLPQRARPSGNFIAHQTRQTISEALVMVHIHQRAMHYAKVLKLNDEASSLYSSLGCPRSTYKCRHVISTQIVSSFPLSRRLQTYDTGRTRWSGTSLRQGDTTTKQK